MDTLLLESIRKKCITGTPVRAPELLTVIERRTAGKMSAKVFCQDKWVHNGFVSGDTRRAASLEIGIARISSHDLFYKIYPYMGSVPDKWVDFVDDYLTNLPKQVESAVKWFEQFHFTAQDKPSVVLSRYLYWEAGHKNLQSIISNHPETEVLLSKALEYRKKLQELVRSQYVAPRGVEDAKTG